MTGPRLRTGAVLLWVCAAMPAARAQEQPLRDVAPPESRPPAAASAPGLRTMPETLADAIGTWDLSLDGGNRRCELSLSGDSGANGRTLRFPAGCRRALPVLAKAVGWLFTGKGIRIVDADIRPLIEFEPRPDGRSMQGRSERGESYSLVPLQTMAMLPPADPGDPAPGPASGAPPPGAGQADGYPADPHPADAHAIPGSQPVLPSDVLTRSGATPAQAGRPDERVAAVGGPAGASAGTGPGGSGSVRPAPGVYALDRFSDKDVCRIALDPRPAAPSKAKSGAKPGPAEASRDPSQDLAPAHILPGCRDSGVVTFDPVSWRFASGHLTLKAKRGHALNLVVTADGTWRRDPDNGTTFVLRRVE